MKGKIIQIATMPETDRTKSMVWALTDEGEVYFLVLMEGIWYRQAAPGEKVEVQENADNEIHDWKSR